MAEEEVKENVEAKEAPEQETETGQVGPADVQVLIVTDKGFAMKTGLDNFKIGRRKTTGVQAMRLVRDPEDKEEVDRGNVIAVKQVQEGQHVFVSTKNGIGAYINTDVVRLTGRKKSGVTLIKLDDKDSVVAVD